MHAQTGKSIRNSVFSVCSFAHLLCVHTVFEEYFKIPFFFYLLTCTVSLHPFTKIPIRNDSICICDVIQVEQKCYACFQKWHTSILTLFQLPSLLAEELGLCTCRASLLVQSFVSCEPLIWKDLMSYKRK